MGAMLMNIRGWPVLGFDNTLYKNREIGKWNFQAEMLL